MTEPLDDSVPRWLIGRWRLLRAEASLDFAPGVTMEFRLGGRLLYTIVVEGRAHVIELVYRVDGNTLSTDNPAAPHATSTRFGKGAGGVLEFDFAEGRAWFVRES
jgi:hypothetical protein